MFDLSGKVAVVTGGSSGIGLGMARGLAKAHASVAIAARNLSGLENAEQELQSLGAETLAIVADMEDPQSPEKMVGQVVDHFGRLDILVNNAGSTVRKRPESLTLDDWNKVINLNLTSVFLCAQAAYPHLKKSGHGKIINNGSMASLFGMPFAAAYGSSKGGIVQLTQSLATAWADDNIQVNVILPGWIDTPLTVQAREQVPALHDKVLARCPAGRWGTGADFEGATVFLASSASDYITGISLPIDGGYSISG
ncbi:MAG: glucose 1-dehydrogenase [SAR324 cluster bacterium]|nr:glucose 1-dehydrogenase [SAR324 cluster bacterium]